MCGVKFTSIARELKRSAHSMAKVPIIQVAFIDTARSRNFHDFKNSVVVRFSGTASAIPKGK